MDATSWPPSLAAIDVGTNSIHLVVARVVDGEHFEVIAQEKEMVRLGSGGGDMKRLRADAIDRGIAALTRFKQVADISDAPVHAVATSAMREAENRDEFIERAAREAGVNIEVISGIEEARLIRLGVLQAVPVYDRRSLVVDIGGGSTEFIIGHRDDVLLARSLKLGAVRLTSRFFPDGHVRRGEVDECRHFVQATMAELVHDARPHTWEVTVGSSGTIEAVAALALATRGEHAPRTFNNHELTSQDVDDAVNVLVDAPTTDARRRLPGMDPKRADIIVAGALVLEGVCHELGVKQLVFSHYALREGVLLDTLQRRRGGSLHHLHDLSRRSVRTLLNACDPDPEHAITVARHALSLFDATQPLHNLDEGCREYLEAAALLANVGLVISHARHHLHSYYVIRNAERLLGFTDREIEIIAQVARYHRKSAPKLEHEAFAALSPDDRDLVRLLAGLLRVAIGLDRSHDDRVGSIEAWIEAGEVRFEVSPVGESDISLELYSAQARADLLAQQLKRAVRVVQAGAA